MNPEKIKETDYLDLLFGGRNKDYGGYELRKRYKWRVLLGAGITLGIVALLCAANLIQPKMRGAADDMSLEPPIVLQPLPEQPTKPPPTPPLQDKGNEAARAAMPGQLYTAIKIVPKDKLNPKERPDPPRPTEDSLAAVHNDNEPDAAGMGLKPNGKGGSNVVDGPDDRQGASVNKNIMAIQQLASYPGGEAALYKYIQDNLRYPSGAMEQNIQGQVLVEFVVAANGQVGSIIVVRDLGYGTAAEAVRILGSMPRWHPAKQNDQPIASYFTLPITFKLH